MELFIDTEFEPAMDFLMSTLDYCIENNVKGWINKKNDHFTAKFFFFGIKINQKRKATDNLCAPSSKIRKITNSIENLLLAVAEDHRMETFEPSSSGLGSLNLGAIEKKKRKLFAEDDEKPKQKKYEETNKN